jgi:hypothetical protein
MPIPLLGGVEMSIATPEQSTAKPIPPLRNGDRLTAEEFERRNDAMPGLKKAELINGVVYLPSPVIFEDHGGPHFDVIAWLGFYRAATPGIRGADNATLRLPLANRPQPDACLIILPTFGGQVRIDDEGYIVGGPELAAEVAATSENYDLHDKLDLYRRNAVREWFGASSTEPSIGSCSGKVNMSACLWTQIGSTGAGSCRDFGSILRPW